MSRKKHEEKEPNHERWLLTYSDLITLLMIFFIVMYSFSNIDKEKYRQVVYGLNKAMGSGGGKNIIGNDRKDSREYCRNKADERRSYC
jgi:chemotaxis protein MotB